MLFATNEEREEAVAWITGEINLAETEMAGKIEKWNRWRRQREALPEFAKKTFPGTSRVRSNVVPPISMNNTNTVYANLNNKFGSVRPMCTVGAVREDNGEDIAIAKFMTRYMDILGESRNDLDRKRKGKVVHYEVGSLGFCIVKVPWTRREWVITETDPLEGTAKDTLVKLHEGPEFVPIPAEDFLIREAYQDIQTAPWCAHVLHKTWPEIQQLGEVGFYENVDQLEAWARDEPTESEKQQQEREGATQLADSEVWDLHEVYFFWEVDGHWRDCTITLERNSGIVLRENYNELGWRLFQDFTYLLRPFRREGIGVGHMTEQMQEAGTMIWNARLDSIHASVIPMFKGRKNSGVKADEPVYPGKVWLLDDPTRDLDAIKLPEPGNASFIAENSVMQWAQKATGMGDAVGGFADATVRTRDSPGLMQMRMKQASGVFGSVTEGIEDSWSGAWYMVFLQLIHHKDEVLANEREIGRLSEGDIALLEKALSIPKEQVPIRLRFSVRTSDVEQTFEVKRQNLLTRTQLSNQFFQQMFPVVQMLFGPQGQMMMQQVPEMWKFLARVYTAQARMLEEAMKFFGEDDTSKYVPDYKKLEALLDLQRLMQEANNTMGGVKDERSGGYALPAPAAEGAQGTGGIEGTAGSEAAAGGAAGAGQAASGASVEPGVGGVF